VQTGGPGVSLDGARSARPSFEAPSRPEAVELAFELTVSDGRGLSRPDRVVVTVGASDEAASEQGSCSAVSPHRAPPLSTLALLALLAALALARAADAGRRRSN
jgi:hypothetical protein